MRATSPLRRLWRHRGYRRLLTVRLLGQVGDGTVQVGAAAYIVLDPERQPDAAAIAGLFAATLLPYSVLGPFAGLGLDRWSRRQVLLIGNLTRAAIVAALAGLAAGGATSLPFFLTLLAALGVNRFLLAGLSAGLPHVVDRDELLVANAVTPTAGSAALVVGTVLAGGLSALFASSLPAIVAAGCLYLLAGGTALLLRHDQLGPTRGVSHTRGAPVAPQTPTPDPPGTPQAATPDSPSSYPAEIVRGLVDAIRYVARRRALGAALGAIALSRLVIGFLAVLTILWFRNGEYAGRPPAALGAIATAAVALGVGVLVAAVVTPALITRLGLRRQVGCYFAGLGVIVVWPTLLFNRQGLLAAALGAGFAAQGIKIAVDTVLQRCCADDYRGRVFALHDMVYNASQVAAAGLAALTLPIDGRSLPALVVVGLVCGAAASAAYPRRLQTLRTRRARPTRP